MSMYGDYVVRTVSQGAAPVVVAQWQPLVSVAGAGPLTDRRYVRFMIRGNRGHTVALQYVAKAADGTFTAPAANTNIKLSTSFPGVVASISKYPNTGRVIRAMSRDSAVW